MNADERGSNALRFPRTATEGRTPRPPRPRAAAGRNSVCRRSYRQAEPLPAGRGHIGENRLDDVQRQVQPVRFLGVHAQPDVRLLRLPGQPCEPGHELTHDPFALGELVAGMQRRELDPPARPLDDAAAGAAPPHGAHGPALAPPLARALGRAVRPPPQAQAPARTTREPAADPARSRSQNHGGPEA